MFSASQRYQRSPIGSNYDWLTTSIIPRTRSATDAFGMDSRSQATPNLRQQPPQDGLFHEEEPDYRTMLADEPFTPSLMRLEARPHSSGLSSGQDLINPLALSNIVSTIGAQFGLSSSVISDVDKVFQQPDQQRRQIALVCFLASKFQSHQQNLSTPELPTVPQSDPTKVTEWKALEDVRSYSAANSMRTVPVLESLENLVIVVKDIAKTEKSKFQQGLLVHIKDPELDSKVPKLENLYFQLRRTRAPKELTKSNDTIWDATSLGDKCRIALLRLEGTIFHMEKKDSTQPCSGTKDKGDRSMWDPVDERLSWVRGLPRDQQKSFYRWVIQYDTVLFTGAQSFEQIKTATSNDIHIITPEALKIWISEGEPEIKSPL
ncbi:uncharacterized protein MELLADRAFT_94788 [Melampsora larici-populina 98AG31]|uniref:Uncharacterized protein n=1 Tax=Melampsora larici-populina (strain 98AG31 / pathotype 3-4-7) TaxID=747676 RepID=F4S7X5_MELLP|nr:uncharacterized protein MELLADRAFT_94788 [Melampsora larici-populina 98AG31]EGF99185.1 hypothetical protein MELLADRAFT_94788 [Melampsora larici-populina 98AG31]